MAVYRCFKGFHARRDSDILITMKHLFLLALLFFFTACEGEAPKQDTGEDKPPALSLVPVSFGDLPDWNKDDMTDVALPLARSCALFLKRPPSLEKMGDHEEFASLADWQNICRAFSALPQKDHEHLKTFFERYFQPYQALADDKEQGLFTGYYEASLKGAATRSEEYNIPLHARPDDLVMVQLGDFREDLKGRRIAGRVIDGRLRPYEPREDIVSGDWPHNDKVLVWVNSAVDAFFVQIQGSGLIEMQDGSVMRIGYAGQNGHPYYAIGRELIKRGHIAREDISMQSIRKWLEENPEAADEIMNTNKSYVFFRELTGDGPIGGQGVALSAARSLAVDHSLYPYGIPVWLDLEMPQDELEFCTPAANDARKERAVSSSSRQSYQNCRLARLMVAQDTGGAIRGPVRGDVFWGHGIYAEHIAGKMAQTGRMWVLLPKANSLKPARDNQLQESK